MYYNHNDALKHYFLSTAAHNTIEIDNGDQMEKGPRFLFLDWVKSRCLRFTDNEGLVFTGEHTGYQRLEGRVDHRRTIRNAGTDTWHITDRIPGVGKHTVTIRWRLCPDDDEGNGSWTLDSNTATGLVDGQRYAIRVEIPRTETPDLQDHGQAAKLHLVSGQDKCDLTGGRPEGWESLYYGQKTPAPTLILTTTCSLPVTIETTCGPADEVEEEETLQEQETSPETEEPDEEQITPEAMEELQKAIGEELEEEG
jgi:hypothetical protein